MWVVIGFAALGFLIGNLLGLTSESIVAQLVGLLFVFVGGSVFAFLHKLSAADRKIAGGALFSLSLACTVGMYVGISISEHRWFSPLERKNVVERYVRNGTLSRAASIDLNREKDKPEGAYQQMYKLALEYEDALERSRK